MPTRSQPTKTPAKPRSKLFGIAVVMMCMLHACTAERIPANIPFIASFDGTPIDCNSQPVALTDLRFFVTDIVLGANQPMPLLRDDIWQTRDLALIDLEDNVGACRNGTVLTNDRIRGTLANTAVTGLSFTVGVPFDLNHADPLRAEAPLNDGNMHWHWRSGYKFLRAGVGRADDHFWIHLGSTACEGRVGAITVCHQPNRVRVSLPSFTLGDTVEIDLARLIDAALLQDATPTDCSSGPAEATCGAPFVALGLAHADQESAIEQTLFKVRH